MKLTDRLYPHVRAILLSVCPYQALATLKETLEMNICCDVQAMRSMMGQLAGIGGAGRGVYLE